MPACSEKPEASVRVDVSVTASLYADSPYRDQFVCVLRQVGIDRVLFGSDYPFYTTTEAIIGSLPAPARMTLWQTPGARGCAAEGSEEQNRRSRSSSLESDRLHSSGTSSGESVETDRSENQTSCGR